MNRIILATGLATALVVAIGGGSFGGERSTAQGGKSAAQFTTITTPSAPAPAGAAGARRP